jgi:hypothetical protein
MTIRINDEYEIARISFAITSTIANLRIPLTGSTAMGFAAGIIKG